MSEEAAGREKLSLQARKILAESYDITQQCEGTAIGIELQIRGPYPKPTPDKPKVPSTAAADLFMESLINNLQELRLHLNYLRNTLNSISSEF